MVEPVDAGNDSDASKSCLPFVDQMSSLYEKYDATFLNLLAMQYFNHGSKVMIGLAAKDLFKAYYNLEPGHVQVLAAYIGIPWSLKILYGLISDNVPLCGSRRKSYL